MSNHITADHYAVEEMGAFFRDILNCTHQRKITREKIARVHKQNMYRHTHKRMCTHPYSYSPNSEGVHDMPGRLRMRNASSARYC